MATTDNQVPFMATHVGEFIKDELKERSMSQRELSGLTGIQAPIINDIVKGKRGITPEMAVLLENALDIPAYIFMNIQTNYELDKARISQRVAEQTKAMEVWSILEQFICLPFLKKMKCIGKDVRENVDNVLAMFGVKNIDDFLTLQSKETTEPYFSNACLKKSDRLKTDPNALFSWKYYCFSKAKTHPINTTFYKEVYSTLCESLNEIFRVNKDTIALTKQTLEDYGIRLLIIEKTDHLPVDGFSFWRDDNPTIAVTLRKKTIDNFAFTIFHELGHICIHLQPNQDGNIDFAEDPNPTSIESEANEFAKNAMIPKSDWEAFIRKTKNKSAFQIRPLMEAFCNVHRINPQIGIGRYKFETGNYRIPNWFESALG